MRISLFFAWYDMWVGAYIDRENRTVYVCPLPMVVLRIQLAASTAEGGE